jgi:hypothetical protein
MKRVTYQEKIPMNRRMWNENKVIYLQKERRKKYDLCTCAMSEKSLFVKKRIIGIKNIVYEENDT